MTINETSLKDVKIIEPDVFTDNRGFFLESYSSAKFLAAGITDVFIQDNHSLSKAKGTLRGLHFQLNPKAQAKIVRCTRGAVLDVAVDIRKSSPTYGKWVAFELSAENFRQVYIPAGFTHGFLTLTDDVEIQYKTSELYVKDLDRCIRWDDPEIGVDWGIENPILSEIDAIAPLLRECENNFE